MNNETDEESKVCKEYGSTDNQKDFTMIYKSPAEKFLGISPSVPLCKKCYDMKGKNGVTENSLDMDTVTKQQLVSLA